MKQRVQVTFELDPAEKRLVSRAKKIAEDRSKVLRDEDRVMRQMADKKMPIRLIADALGMKHSTVHRRLRNETG